MTRSPRALVTGAGLGAAALATGLLLTACSSSANSGTPAGGGGTGAGTTAATTSAVTVESHSGPMGTYLTDGAGNSVYMFAPDTATKSACTGTCQMYWPPLTTTSAAKAGSGTQSGKLGTIAGANGTKQVTYAGHPLYHYSGDSSAGDTSGQGKTDFGGTWSLLAPAGSPVTAGGAGSSSAPSTSSGGGGGGGWS